MPRAADHSHVAPGFGARLREARGAISMRELAAEVGVSSAYISRIEDERVPWLQLVYRFADQLHVNRGWLATGETIDERDQELLALRRENERLRRTLAQIRSLADETL